MITTEIPIGFPSRPTGGGVLPDSFTLLPSEVATPKLNGDRVLMSHKGECYNRKMQKYTRIDAEDALMLHQALNHPNFSEDEEENMFYLTDTVKWWDIEYMSHGRNKGCAVVIDVVTGDNKNYHERRKCTQHLPPVDHRWTEDLFSEWRGATQHRRDLVGKVFRFPFYRNTMSAKIAYGYMQRRYEQYLGEDRPNEYLWEGLVIQDTSPEYELTIKQSMNKHMQTKYRFR